MKMNKVTFAGFFRIFLISTLLTFAGYSASSQSGDPPPPPGEHGETGNQVPGGGAPVGGGIILLSLFAAGYGGFKYRQSKKTRETKLLHRN